MNPVVKELLKDRRLSIWQKIKMVVANLFRQSKERYMLDKYTHYEIWLDNTYIGDMNCDDTIPISSLLNELIDNEYEINGNTDLYLRRVEE